MVDPEKLSEWPIQYESKVKTQYYWSNEGNAWRACNLVGTLIPGTLAVYKFPGQSVYFLTAPDSYRLADEPVGWVFPEEWRNKLPEYCCVRVKIGPERTSPAVIRSLCNNLYREPLWQVFLPGRVMTLHSESRTLLGLLSQPNRFSRFLPDEFLKAGTTDPWHYYAQLTKDPEVFTLERLPPKLREIDPTSVTALLHWLLLTGWQIVHAVYTAKREDNSDTIKLPRSFDGYFNLRISGATRAQLRHPNGTILGCFKEVSKGEFEWIHANGRASSINNPLLLPKSGNYTVDTDGPVLKYSGLLCGSGEYRSWLYSGMEWLGPDVYVQEGEIHVGTENN